MKSISVAGQAKLAQINGTEPLNIVEIDWNGAPTAYADKALGSIHGSILQLGELDHVINVSRSSHSQAIDLVLDDADGSIKAILDTTEVHRINARVYQYFEGMDIADKFLIFSGKISSPIIWSEADRTFKCSIISQIEDLEFGFSPEEAEITGLPADLVGKPWPVVFGTCVDVPAVPITKAVTGTSMCGVGILSGVDEHLNAPLGNNDCGFWQSIALALEAVKVARRAALLWAGADIAMAASYDDKADSILAQTSAQVDRYNYQQVCALANRQTAVDDAEANGLGCNPVRILGGEDMPQGRELTLNIGGGLFTGTMSGQDFTITSRRHIESEDLVELAASRITLADCEPDESPTMPFAIQEPVPPGTGSGFKMDEVSGYVVPDPDAAFELSFGYVTCPAAPQVPNIFNILQHFYARAGARVSIEDGDYVGYVASITPGTVLDVKAYRQFEAENRLVSVPTSYYTTSVVDFGSFTATFILMDKALSTRTDEGWSDQIYVTFKGDVGPDTVDIVEWIVDNYTDLTVDTTSFETVRTHLTPFPSNFAVLDRRNTLEVLRQIAFDARCAVWVSNGVIYLKYLPVEPSSDLTVTVSDIELGSVEVSTVETESLVTKMNVTYTTSYAEPEKNKITLRNNVGKFGTVEQTFNWLAYTQADIVFHVASFWALRLSTSWKRIKFSGFLPLMRLEPFDTITLDVPSYVASSAVKAMVESAKYDSATQTVVVECLVPVVGGAMEKHPLFWPAGATETYPTIYDQPGGSGIGGLASGVLPVGDISHLINIADVFVGGPNTIFKARSDQGTAKMFDTDFEAAPLQIEEAYADFTPGAAPELDLGIDWLTPLPPIQLQLPTPSGGGGLSQLDIHTVVVYDSVTGKSSLLSDIISAVDGAEGEEQARLRTDVLWQDATDNVGTFDFRWDSLDSEFGAGTAFYEDAE